MATDYFLRLTQFTTVSIFDNYMRFYMACYNIILLIPFFKS